MLENLRKGHKSNKIGSLQEVDRGHGSSQTNSPAGSFVLRKTHRTGALQGAEDWERLLHNRFPLHKGWQDQEGPP